MVYEVSLMMLFSPFNRKVVHLNFEFYFHLDAGSGIITAYLELFTIKLKCVLPNIIRSS